MMAQPTPPVPPVPATPPRTPEQVRAAGIRALLDALGPDDLVRFLLQFDRGSGDYTAARQAWVDQLYLDTILSRVRQDRDAAPAAGRDSESGPSR